MASISGALCKLEPQMWGLKPSARSALSIGASGLELSAELSKNVPGKILQGNVPEGSTLREHRGVAGLYLGRPLLSKLNCGG